jgi:hypothetical protein
MVNGLLRFWKGTPVTEAEWLRCESLVPLLHHLQGVAAPAFDQGWGYWPDWIGLGGPCPGMSPRRVRLFNLACCRRLWRLPLDAMSRTILSAYGRFVDRKTDRAEFEATCRTFVRPLFTPAATSIRPWAALGWTDTALGALRAAREVSWMVASAAAPEAWTVLDTCASIPDDMNCRVYFGQPHSRWQALRANEEKEQANLLRHVIGNPFRPAAVDPAWLSAHDGVARAIVQVIHDEQRYDDLPFLADALEDAGCTDADLLGHCRGPGPHFRGCWAVGLILSKDR